jgi:hypothetical protein
MKQISGIYSLCINDKLYIGSSVHINKRLIQHFSDLKCNKHCNIYLQNAYNKYKEVKVKILEESVDYTGEELCLREKYYITLLNPEYNIQDPVTNFNVKKVYQFDKLGKLICEYESVYEASQKLNISISNIQHAAQINEKNTKTAGGFYWSYTTDCNINLDKRHHTVYVYDITGKYLTYYDTLKELCNTLFPNRKEISVPSVINRICNNKTASLEGFRFSYKKVDQLDNSLLLKINKNYPIVQMSYDNQEIINTWCTIKEASNSLNIKAASIVYALSNNSRCQSYYWKRLGSI